VSAEDAIVACSDCGATAPRGDMFGVEPELLCEACADGVRSRMHVRFRPLAQERPPRATALCLALAAVLYICAHVIWPQRPDTVRPDWLTMLYQGWSIWGGAVWKHLTSCFLHGGLLHVLMNAGALWWLGRPLEQRWGTPAFVGLLVATGMAGGAAEWIISDAGAVGLSGAIFGFAGFLMARRRDDAVAAQLMDDRTIRFVLGWGLLCIVLTITKIQPIANYAHGVGLATGWLLGRASAHSLRKLLVPAAAMVCVLLVVASVFIALGEVRMESGESWSRQRWRTYWLEHHR